MKILLRGSLTALGIVAVMFLSGCAKGDRDIAPADLRVVGATDGWYEVSTKKGGFKALMPGQPKAETNVIEVSEASVRQYWLVCELSGTVAFGIFYNAFEGSAEERLLADACRGASCDAKVIRERDISLPGARGREMIMEKMGGSALVSARVYVRKNVVYLVSAIVPQEKPRAEETAKFLDSFTFSD